MHFTNWIEWTRRIRTSGELTQACMQECMSIWERRRILCFRVLKFDICQFLIKFNAELTSFHSKRPCKCRRPQTTIYFNEPMILIFFNEWEAKRFSNCYSNRGVKRLMCYTVHHKSAPVNYYWGCPQHSKHSEETIPHRPIWSFREPFPNKTGYNSLSVELPPVVAWL